MYWGSTTVPTTTYCDCVCRYDYAYVVSENQASDLKMTHWLEAAQAQEDDLHLNERLATTGSLEETVKYIVYICSLIIVS